MLMLPKKCIPQQQQCSTELTSAEVMVHSAQLYGHSHWNCTKAIISHSPKSRSIMNCDLTVPQLLCVHTGQAAGLRTIIGITLMLSSEIHAKTHCCNDKLGPCISDVTLYNLQCYIEDDSPFPPTRTDTHRSFGDAKCLCFSNKIWRKHVHCLASCTRDHRVQLRESKPAIMTF